MNGSQIKACLGVSLFPVLLIALPVSFWAFYLRLLALFFIIVLLLLLGLIGKLFFQKKGSKHPKKRHAFFSVSRAMLLLYSLFFTLLGGVRFEKGQLSFPTSQEKITHIYGKLFQLPTCLGDRIEIPLWVTGVDFADSGLFDCYGSASGVLKLSLSLKDKLFKERERAYEKWVIGDAFICQVKAKKGNRSFPQKQQKSWDFTLCSIEVIPQKEAPFWNQLVYQARASFSDWYYYIREREEKEQSQEKPLSAYAGLVLALLDGERGFVEEGVRRAYVKAGVSHLLALSGMHLGVIALLLTSLVKPFLGRKKALLVVFFFSFFYVLIAGASPSLVRAFIMMGLALLFRLRGGTFSMLWVLVLALPLSIAFQPYSIQSPALILSYLALAGLLLLDPVVKRCFLPLFPSSLARGISASLSAQLATAWWSFPTFGLFSTGGIAAALFLTPITFVVMGGGFLSFFFFLIGAKNCSFLLLWLTSPFYFINRFLLILFSLFPTINSWVSLIGYFFPLFLLALTLFFYYRFYLFSVSHKKSAFIS